MLADGVSGGGDRRCNQRVGMLLQESDGVSGVRGPNKATRSAVCFHSPVSENRRTFFADKHSLMPSVTDIGFHFDAAAQQVIDRLVHIIEWVGLVAREAVQLVNGSINE